MNQSTWLIQLKKFIVVLNHAILKRFVTKKCSIFYENMIFRFFFIIQPNI